MSLLAKVLNTSYLFKEKDETDEIHIFEGQFSTDKKSCTTKSKSICGAVKKTDCSTDKSECLTERQARLEAARIGRKVCANCVRTFYKTY